MTTALSTTAPELGVREFRDWYRSSEVFEAEQRRLFAPSWSSVASGAELAEPGAYVSATVAGVPIAVVRDDAGELVAFENLCRHRAIPLLSGCGHTGRYLTCPYHQWSYRRDGSLATVPQMEAEFPELVRSELGLRRVGVEEWAGIVFVRAEEKGTSLPDALGPLRERLAGYADGPLAEVAHLEIEAACNWKLLVENHVDVYHLWYLHQRTLRHYDHQQFFWEFLGDNWWSMEPLLDVTTAPRELDFLPEDQRVGIGAHLLFPNVMIVTSGAYFGTYEAKALAPDRTVISLRVRSRPGADADALVGDIRAFLLEDLAACEQLQAATGSPSYGFGPLALNHEEPIRRFHEALRRTLGG